MEDRRIQAAMTMLEGEEAGCAVTMLVDVPLHVRIYSVPCGRDVHQRVYRMRRPVLESFEQRFGVRIVVTDRPATQACHDAERDHRRQYRGAFHPAAIVGVQKNLAESDIFAPAQILDLQQVLLLQSGGVEARIDDRKLVGLGPCIVVVPSNVVRAFKIDVGTMGLRMTFATGVASDVVERSAELREFLQRSSFSVVTRRTLAATDLTRRRKRSGIARAGRGIDSQCLLYRQLLQSRAQYFRDPG